MKKILNAALLGIFSLSALFPLSAGAQTYTAAQVAAHNTQASAWIILNNKVYDITAYLPSHPGGVNAILAYAGGNATAAFSGHSQNANSLLANYYIGDLAVPTPTPTPTPTPSITPTPTPSPNKPVKIIGRITSLASTSLTVFTRKTGTTTIDLATSTVIKKDGRPAGLSALFVGAKVKIKGVWNSVSGHLTAIQVKLTGKRDHDDREWKLDKNKEKKQERGRAGDDRNERRADNDND